jgi:hypothetical protein
MKVTVLIAYRPGTSGIMEACLRSFFRHTPSSLVEVRVIHDEKHQLDILPLLNEFGVEAYGYPVDEKLFGSYIHGTLLNQAVRQIRSDYLLTLDSDCFPVADGWLEDLIRMLDGRPGCAGILYPWQPIPEGMLKGNIEKRIREKHCWNNTHVACQLAATSFIFGHSIDFMAEDDTGFAVPMTAHKMGFPVVGFKASRGPFPNPGIEFDPEWNRHMSLIFGDKVYHHGGATQTLTGYKIDKDGMFSEAQAKVIEMKGAEWMLEAGNSHQFRFDNEEKVCDFKMENMYREMVQFLQTNDRLFNP